LKLRRLTLTAFFIALTLSIGLVSVNLPLTVMAQNSALSQSGNSDSEQEIKQSQSSDQNGQVVSGDSSILSGNNLACQDQDNSEAGLGLCTDRAIPPGSVIRTIHLHTVLFADCFPIGPPCPSPDGYITSPLFTPYYAPRTNQPGGMTDVSFDWTVGAPYSFQARGGDGGPYFTFDHAQFVGDCSGRNSCNSVVGPDGAEVGVYLYYKPNSE
jgi:hypothetical protein